MRQRLLEETMLEHEKIFRDQVRELHRVYRIQKLLMSQQRQGGLVGLFSSTQSNDKLSAESLPSCSDEECDLDLTLSIGLGGGKKKARSGSRSDTKFGCCPESSANSTGRRAAFAPARSDPGAAAGPLCRC
ncbi:unnamed protein product [Spirodela intermedia]|uniref:Uncharacterized protein n=1 Tax=Spirodela intermedia TaxID=51605 RepID=A0A7I8JLX3_SPIIN|nr:unnamed protein product [Spirodela intermedia]CAA6671100.1 unnamed protein product [Spirodela intermedia]